MGIFSKARRNESPDLSAEARLALRVNYPQLWELGYRAALQNYGRFEPEVKANLLQVDSATLFELAWSLSLSSADNLVQMAGERFNALPDAPSSALALRVGFLEAFVLCVHPEWQQGADQETTTASTQQAAAMIEAEILQWYSRAVWAPVGVEADAQIRIDPATDPSVQPEPCPACAQVLPKDHALVSEHILAKHALSPRLTDTIRETEQNLVLKASSREQESTSFAEPVELKASPSAVSWSPTDRITDPEFAFIPRRLTGSQLAQHVRAAAEHHLNLYPSWREEDGHTFVEQKWQPGKVETEEVLPDQECALLPVGLSSKDAMDLPAPPQWRCQIFLRGLNGFKLSPLYLDVFVADCQMLDPIDRLSDPVFTCIPRRATGVQLGALIGMAVENGLNRAPPWREEGRQGFIESGGRVVAEIALDQEYVLLPNRLHHHRMGQPAPPHWRCDLYVQGPDGLRPILRAFLDVFVPEFDALPPAEV